MTKPKIAGILVVVVAALCLVYSYTQSNPGTEEAAWWGEGSGGPSIIQINESEAAGSDNSYRAQGKIYCPKSATSGEMVKFVAAYFGKSEQTIRDYGKAFAYQLQSELKLPLNTGSIYVFLAAEQNCNSTEPRGPSLSNLTPKTVEAGKYVTISGAGFDMEYAKKNTIWFNDKIVATVYGSRNYLRFTVPPTTHLGTYKVKVSSFWGTTVNTLPIVITKATATPTPASRFRGEEGER